MNDFAFKELFRRGADETPYRGITTDHVAADRVAGAPVLRVAGEGLTLLAFEAFRDMAHLLRPGHLESLRRILDDPEASDNDRFVALDLLKNACIAAGGVLPMCQDTGTAIVMGEKGHRVWTDGGDAVALARGVHRAYRDGNLRYSQMAPIGMFEEVNTRDNLPAQIDLQATDGEEYRFLFVAKGGGSANKTFLFQETPALLDPESLLAFLDEKIRALGTAACPPYHLAVVIGGTSAEATLKTVKLASCHYLDGLPEAGGEGGLAFRDRALEAEIFERTRRFGIGAQFGGKYFCHDVRVVRLPRHGGSLPIGIGVSCSADRQAVAKVTADGLFLERLEANPARFLPETTMADVAGAVVPIDLARPIDEIRATLGRHPVKARLSLNGPMVVARDLAHARIRAAVEAGARMPDYMRDRVVYYAGPAKTPAGYATGSFGPTTAARMDPYMDFLMARGAALITLAKGNRGPAVRAACRTHGGFYLGSIGGPGARLAQDCIRKVEPLDFADLGMEAVWRIEVVDFPAFIVIDDKGNDFFAQA